ncbi:MAG: hypothetical protein CMP95_02790 [Gammaproteobacteria bacterium]|nr:hypothetical protein [Gammaproteobacteria bacterium]|tara:strand:+ start:23736 stop:24062 length:327 start_codon:yes stop_codon:yes gene_type:complete
MKTTTRKITKRQIDAFTKKVEKRIERANDLWDKYHELDVRSTYNQAPYARVRDARRKFDAHIRESIQWLHEVGVCGPGGITEEDCSGVMFLNFMVPSSLLMFSDGSWA